METPKYKVGDICLIKGGKLTENIGKTVTLVRWMNQGEQAWIGNPARHFNAENYSGWVVEGTELKVRFVVRSTQEEIIMIDTLGAYRECHLVKIGDSDPDLVQTKERKHLIPA